MLSTLKLTSFHNLGKQQLKKIRTIWQSLQDSNDSVQFRMPVDWQGLGLIDYPTFVKNPMDLNTVNNNLNQEKYQSVEEVLDDIQLIWDNCKVYNKKGSWIWDLADKLQKLFKRSIKAHLPMITLPGTNSNSKSSNTNSTKIQQQVIKHEEKMNFVERIKVLRPQQLEDLVLKIQEICPQAFKQVQQQRAQINVDKMNQESWKKVLSTLQNLQQTKDPVTKRQKI